MDGLFAKVAAGATVITPTSRLASYLVARFNAHMLNTGQEVWRSPEIFQLSVWLHSLWQSRGEDWPELTQTVYLGDQRERLLWEKVIGEELRSRDSGIELLWDLSATARMAQKSWGLLNDWNLTLQDFPDYLNQDCAAFSSWAVHYDTVLHQKNWIDQAGLSLAVIRNMARFPEVVVFAGFELINPRQKMLTEVMEEQGVDLQIWMPETGGDRSLRQIRCRDSTDEIRRAAAWACERLQLSPLDPVGIVVPDLAKNRSVVEAAMEDTFSPGAIAPGAGEYCPPYELSLGVPLIEVPLVETAIDLLSLSREGEFDLISRLLRSPYLHQNDSHRESSLDCELTLRRQRLHLFSLTQLRETALSVGAHGWVSGVETLEQMLQGMGQELPAPDWVEHWVEVLNLFGWPGPRTLLDSEYQAVEKFRQLLGAFASTGDIGGVESRNHCLNRLKRAARDLVFHQQTPSAPIQVVGLLESSGMIFSHLWVVGLESEAWPFAPHPDPFLPLSLQSQHQMPGIDSSSSLELATRMTERISSSAEEVVFSWPGQRGETPLMPSPLIAELEQAELTPPPSLAWCDSQRESSPKVKIRKQDPGKPFTGRSAPGGTALFRELAQCPFYAYARRRLGLEEFVDPGFGLDSRDRGILVHSVLEKVWTTVEGSEALQSLSQEQRDRLLGGAVSAALDELEQQRPGVLGERFRELERDRLETRIGRWLELELARPAFEVDSIESDASASLRLGAGTAVFDIRLRPDRVDRLASGGRMVIDYKTGYRAGRGKWFGVPPEEPQLPLYQHLLGDVDAIAFGLIRADGVKLEGVGRRDGIAEGVVKAGTIRNNQKQAKDWASQVRQWERALFKLAAGFLLGGAEAEPRTPQECEGCQARALCRIDE